MSPINLTTSTGKKTVSRYVYSGNFVTTETTKFDMNGHGLHVAGIIARNGNKSYGGNNTYWIRGIAPNANLISLRVLDTNGKGQDSWVISAIQAAINLKSQYNIRVMNLSLGRPVSGPCATDPLCQAVQQAWQAGIVVVVAAGNDGRNNSAGTQGYGTISAPGNSPYVITVGAINTLGTLSRGDDKITSYSSKGPALFDHLAKPDLVAPGNRILSLQGPGSVPQTSYPQNDVPVSGLQVVHHHVVVGLLPVEWNQHGGAHGQRSCRFDAAKESEPDPGPSEGDSDEDRSKVQCGDKPGDRPDDGRHVHKPERSFHSGGGISGCASCAQLGGSAGRECQVAGGNV